MTSSMSNVVSDCSDTPCPVLPGVARCCPGIPGSWGSALTPRVVPTRYLLNLLNLLNLLTVRCHALDTRSCS